MVFEYGEACTLHHMHKQLVSWKENEEKYFPIRSLN